MAVPSNSRTRCRKLKENIVKISDCIFLCSIVFLCSVITTSEAAHHDRFAPKVSSSSNCDPGSKNGICNNAPMADIEPRQDVKQPSEALQALINWLFGPPATVKAEVEHGVGIASTELQSSIAKPEPKNVVPDGTERESEAVGQLDKPANIASGSDKTSANQGRESHKKDIEIMDIQASIGTELHSSHLPGNPSQVNLKDELDLVEKFDRTVKQRPHPQLRSELPERAGRLKREPYKPIKVPYINRNNQENNMLRQRQLLVSPFDQQMLALQQQQQVAAAATAAMLQQQQQMNNIMSGNRYTVLDDYDDDDSDEDSDELDDLTRFGPPLIEHHHMYLRDGLPSQIPVVPVQRKLGWGLRRRSVPNKVKRKQQEDDYDARGKGRVGDGSNWRRLNSKNKKQASSLKSGHWFLDDYDLNSEFHSGAKERKNVPHLLFNKGGHVDRVELDEEEHVEKFNSEGKENNGEKKGSKLRSDIGNALCNGDDCLSLRQTSDTTTTTTTESSSSSTDGSSDTTTTTESSETTTSAATDETTTTTTETTSTTTPKPKPPYKATLNCRCGTQSVRGQSSGNGVIVRYNVNPWLVSLSNGSTHLCSGSIINDRYILTSKNCVRTVSPGIIVTAGLSSQNSTNYTVSRINRNKNFNLALLKLNSTITPSHLMRPVCLPIGKRFAGNYSTGTLVTFKRVSSSLQMVDTEVSILSSCNSTAKGTFCAGPPGSVKCGGDTGGVLMVYRGGYSYEQIGIVAGTVGCRSSSTPGVYTDIRKRTRWILNLTKDAKYCKSPVVTDDDLTSTTRFGDVHFEINDDFADINEYDDFEDVKNNSESESDEDEEDDDHSGEVVDSSSDEE